MSDHDAQRRKPDEGNMVHKSNENDFLALDLVKSKEFKLIRVDVNQMYTVGYKCKSSCAAEDVNLKSYAPQSAETPIVDRKKIEIGESSTVRRSMELFNDEATFSEKISTQQLTESSIKWKNLRSYHCQNPDVSPPEFEHFPMFDINRKIEAIMASNKKNTYGTMSVKMKKESLSLHEKVVMPHEGLWPNNSANIGEPSSRFFQINGKVLTTGGRSDTDSNSSFLGSSWKNVMDGSNRVLREPSPIYSPYPSPSDMHDADEKDDFANKFFLGQKRFRKTDGSDLQHWSKIPKYFKEPTMRDYAFAQVKENSSLERRIIPIGPNCGKKDTSTMPFRNFRSDDEKNDRDVTCAHLIGGSNESSTRTATMYSLPLSQSKSLIGETFSCAQKGDVPSNLRNSESVSASPAEQAACKIFKTGITERQVEHPADRPTYSRHNAAIASQTKTMSLDLNISLAMIEDNTLGSETCSRWIKRLQDHNSEALFLRSNRFKNGDASSSDNHNLRIISSSKTVMPCSGDSEKSAQLWIRRWSHNYHEVSPSATRAPPVEQQERLKELSEKFEGRLLGSIRALALMGKTMTNHRQCKFRRKNASLVWNTSE